MTEIWKIAQRAPLKSCLGCQICLGRPWLITLYINDLTLMIVQMCLNAPLHLRSVRWWCVHCPRDPAPRYPSEGAAGRLWRTTADPGVPSTPAAQWRLKRRKKTNKFFKVVEISLCSGLCKSGAWLGWKTQQMGVINGANKPWLPVCPLLCRVKGWFPCWL